MSDFRPALLPTTNPPPHHILFDLISPTTPPRQLRDILTRFLHRLFIAPPPSTSRHSFLLLLSSTVTAPLPLLSLLTESAALSNPRNLQVALNRLRSISTLSSQLPCPIRHAAYLHTALLQWIGKTHSNSIIIVGNKVVATELNRLGNVQVVYGDDIENVLKHFVAKMHETVVELRMPQKGLALVWRPRVLVTEKPVEGLIAVRVVDIPSLVEDVVGGWAKVLWQEIGNDFPSLLKWLINERLALICVGRAQQGVDRVFVVVPGTAALALVKELGGGDNLMPVPRIHVQEETDISLEQLGIDMLAKGTFQGEGFRLQRESGLACGRRVYFNEI